MPALTCPYCQSDLQSAKTRTKAEEEAIVQECFTCGGHWLPKTLANDLPLQAARDLDAIEPTRQVVPPVTPRCPTCQTRLSLIKHDSVASGIHVWACPEGHGNFFPTDELLKFKKAQEAKITYHELWGIPIKSAVAVLLPVLLVLAITAGIPLTMNQLNTSQETRVAADSPFSDSTIVELPDNALLITFNTSSPATTTLTLFQNGRRLNTYTVSPVPATTHTLTIDTINPDLEYTFTLSTPEFTSEQIKLTPTR